MELFQKYQSFKKNMIYKNHLLFMKILKLTHCWEKESKFLINLSKICQELKQLTLYFSRVYQCTYTVITHRLFGKQLFVWKGVFDCLVFLSWFDYITRVSFYADTARCQFVIGYHAQEKLLESRVQYHVLILTSSEKVLIIFIINSSDM